MEDKHENLRPWACYQITQIGENELPSLQYCGYVYASWVFWGIFPGTGMQQSMQGNS